MIIDMENLNWIFEGIGTELLSLFGGLFLGGVIGYKIGIHNKVKQVQKAGNNSNQTQIGSMNYGSNK